MTLVVRAVSMDDHAQILQLAGQAGIGFTSLPPDAAVLEKKIQRSEQSFAGKPHRPNEETFLLTIEDTAKKKLVGTTGLIAHVGLTRPFYSYKISIITQATQGLGIYSLQKVLHMVNDYTGASEIGSLFLLPEYRRDGIGRFLSRCRYLMLAEFGSIFDKIIISEIRGVQDKNGESPFYNNLARQFFKMEFKQADYVNATQGGQFIADLMPKYPIYINLLTPEAQAVIGQPLEASRPAMDLLMKEGFRHEGYIDVFDAGPTMQAERSRLRTVNESRKLPVEGISREATGKDYMISTTRLADWRACRGGIKESGNGILISEETAEALKVKKGDHVRFAQ